MRSHSVGDQFALFYRAAAIAAHANFAKKGFRQRDLSFFLDLVLNWANLTKVPLIHNAQSLRYLQHLIDEGFARRSHQGKTPFYRLTRLGLLELISEMMRMAGELDPLEFYFLFYFISSYREKIEFLIASEGQQFPVALKLEILALLDPTELLRLELRRCDRELEKLELRIRDTQAGAKLYEEQRRSGRTLSEATEALEKRYPYQLNSQKPLSKLIGEIPPDIAEAELTISARHRVELLFQPAKQLLLRHRENLRQMVR